MQPAEMKAVRASLGLNQSRFARTIGMSRKAVVEMEGGRSPINLRTAKAVQLLAFVVNERQRARDYLIRHPDASRGFRAVAADAIQRIDDAIEAQAAHEKRP